MRPVVFIVPLCFIPCTQVLATEAQPETIVVIADAPLPSGIDAAKLAGEVQTLSLTDLTRSRQTDVVPNAVASQWSSVGLNNDQGSQFQPDFVYRGFKASPISGVAESIAVYEDGMRLNEAFGDNVNWDLVPEFAVVRITLQSNNPVFGLNAIGGAVTLQMKSGLTFEGKGLELAGGSFGNFTGNAEYGGRRGPFAIYFGVGGMRDEGFRYQSQAALRQAYADIAYETSALTLHLTASGALNDIAATGPTPIELLAHDHRSIFTFPQSMRNEMELAQLHGTYRSSAKLSVSFNLYYRRFEQHLIDGNTTDVGYCANDITKLCLEGDSLFSDDALFDSNGNEVPASVLPAGATPGETDFTHTRTNAMGGALQFTLSAPLAGHSNNLVLGASVDHGLTAYSAHGELGALLSNLEVVGAGIVIDQSKSPTASPPIEAPVKVDGDNTYSGLYAIDVLDVTRWLAWSVSGRLNRVDVSLRDRLDSTLNSDHSFTRLNLGSGLTYRFSEGFSAYAGYSESNRTPTAAELSCSDPASPCLLDAFLVSDPDLKQVISRNYELGVRGSISPKAIPGKLDWSVGAYRTEVNRDILLLATSINGFGFFQNAGTTRHQGVDVSLDYHTPHFGLRASYSHLEATFRNTEALSSNSPAADSNGVIFVRPSDQLPMNPENRATLSAHYDFTSKLSAGADLRWQSGQYLVGDESNEEPKLPGFTTVDLHTSFEISPKLTIFGEIENLFDARYYTFGSFTSLDGLPPSFGLTDARTFSPAPGRRFFAGLRAQI